MEASRKSPRKAVKVDGKTPRKKKQKVLALEFDEEDDVKPPAKSSKRTQSEDDEDDEEDEDEEVPISQLRKKRRKSAETESEGVLGFRADEDEMVPAAVDEDILMTPFQTQETDDCEAQERRVKPRAASALPIVFGEKVNKSKVLLECEGDTVDLSGDMGAVGRFNVDRNQELSLDLKGIIYKTIIVPSNTFFVVNVGQTEAKVECIMSDFVQLQADTNCNENETMVEGTLKDFGFDSDEEREHLAINGNGGDKAAADTTEKVKHEEGADNGEQPKKKEKATKAPKSSKAPAKKATVGKPKVRVASAKGVGKKSKATKTKATKK